MTVLNLIKIPVGPTGGSINFQMLPLMIIALRHGPQHGFIAGGIIYGLLTCLTDGYGFACYPFDYLIGFGSVAVMGFFRKFIFAKEQNNYNVKGILFILLAGALSTAVRYIGSNVSSIVVYGYTLEAALAYNAFYNCKNAKEIHLPECLTSIGEHAISDCDSFQEIYIPDSVTNIKRGAFYECDMLKTVMMSESIISVGDYAFFCCPNMNYFVSKNPNATIGYYALGYHLENTHPVMNTDFVVWSTGTGRVKNYASNYDLTFRNISDAASLSTEHYKNYEWCASNLGYNWAKGDKYYFNSAHTPYANGHAGENFNGICSGLSIVSVLTASGRLQISDFATGCSKLRDTTQKGIPYDLRSYITTVWANSGLINNSLLYDYQLDSDNRFGKEMMRYAEYITYGADPSIIGIWGGGDSAHSVVCFGMEYRENTSDKNDACWDGWDARIMIYDVNRSVHDKTDYIYVNLSSGEWSSLLSVRYGTSGKPMHIEMKHSYDKMLNVGKYNMTVEEFFEAIRN